MILNGWKRGRENEIFNYVVRREKRRDFNRPKCFLSGPTKILSLQNEEKTIEKRRLKTKLPSCPY